MARNGKGIPHWREKNAHNLPPRGEIGEDAPLRLNIAAALAYPDGSMTASGLRREAAKGRLLIERTAGKDYTTLGAIRQMRELCRREAKGRGCGYDEHAVTEKPESRITQCGLSEMGHIRGHRLPQR